MKTKFLNLLDSIKTSFWFIPFLMVLSAIGLSILMIYLDREEVFTKEGFGLLFNAGPEGARSVLSTIAGSMMTVAGVAFSITIVALTLASSQFGPRMLRNFMQDRGNQVALGIFISTFIYCLLILRSIDGESFVPYISVTFSVFLALINVGILIYFIHHVSVSIRADSVVTAVYKELEGNLKRFFPDELEENEIKQEKNETEINGSHNYIYNLSASKNGYLQAVDFETLIELTTEENLILNILNRPGEYITAGIPFIIINGISTLEKDTKGKILKAFIIGEERTPAHDPEFAFDQLSEIAVRALSPGINDPYTAVECIDRLGSALCYLTDRKFPSVSRFDSDGNLRVKIKSVTFEGFVNTSFNQIRQYGSTSASVTIRLLEVLKTILIRSRNGEQISALLSQAETIEHSSRRQINAEYDLYDIRSRYELFQIALREHPMIKNNNDLLLKIYKDAGQEKEKFLSESRLKIVYYKKELLKYNSEVEKKYSGQNPDPERQIENLNNKLEQIEEGLNEIKYSDDEEFEKLKLRIDKLLDEFGIEFLNIRAIKG